MKDGRIAEEGTHEGLMTENGEYSALIKTFHEIEEKERTIKEKDNLSVAAGSSRHSTSFYCHLCTTL